MMARVWAAGTDLHTCSRFGAACAFRLGELRQIASRTCVSVCVPLVVRVRDMLGMTGGGVCMSVSAQMGMFVDMRSWKLCERGYRSVIMAP